MATDFPANPSNGDTHAGFTYNSTTGAWESSASTSSSIDALTDVDTTTSAPSTNDLLKWNGTNWVPTTPAPGGITHQDTWRLSSNVTSDTSPITTWTNTATNPTFQTTLGSPMTHSSGYFTFPTTGYWRVEFFARINLTTSDNLNIGIAGASYSSGTLQTFTGLALQTVGDTGYVKTGYVATHMNVTSTADIKVGFYTSSITSGNSLVASAAGTDYSYVMFTRLADSV